MKEFNPKIPAKAVAKGSTKSTNYLKLVEELRKSPTCGMRSNITPNPADIIKIPTLLSAKPTLSSAVTTKQVSKDISAIHPPLNTPTPETTDAVHTQLNASAPAATDVVFTQLNASTPATTDIVFNQSTAQMPASADIAYNSQYHSIPICGSPACFGFNTAFPIDTTKPQAANNLCQYINQKVSILIAGTQLQVVICAVTPTTIRAFDYINAAILYINISHIEIVSPLPMLY